MILYVLALIQQLRCGWSSSIGTRNLLDRPFDKIKFVFWGYLAQRVIVTPGWNVIKTYQPTTNAPQAWLDLQTFYAGPVESWKKLIVARAALKILRYKSEETFTFASYASQMMQHFYTLERGGQGESKVHILVYKPV